MSKSQSQQITSHPHPHPQPKLNLFSCSFFRNCTQSSLSPSTTPPATSTTPSPPLPPPATTTTTSSSSSSSASHSFTQWRLPVHQQSPSPPPPQNVDVNATIAESYSSAELHFASGDCLQGLRILERVFSPDPSPPSRCPTGVMCGVVSALHDSNTARPAAKVLLALLLNEGNRAEAVKVGAAWAALEAIMASGPSGPTAERALAALELLCTIPDGAESVRNHQLSTFALVRAIEGMPGRGRECAIGVLAAIYGSSSVEVPGEVTRVVVAAMQGECSPRGRRKGAQLLRVLQETGRLDLAWDGIAGS